MTSTKLQSLLQNPSVNSSSNDVRWASGWTGKIHTAQYRLGSAEARKFIGALDGLTRGQQKSVLKELQKVTAKAGGVGSVSIISGAAASVFEAAAKKLGLSLEFEVIKQRAPAPMG